MSRTDRTDPGAGGLGALCREVTDRLLDATASSRTTVRLIDEDGDLVLMAESLAPGVPSMVTGPSVDPRLHETYVYLEREREPLIQADCRTAAIRPPGSLIEHYRVLAQMLAPVVAGGDFRGTISVHLMDRTRRWSQEDVDALCEARRELERALAGGPET